MHIGLQITESDWPREIDIIEKLREIVKTADKAGFYSLGVPDHFFNAMDVVGHPFDSPKLEGYSTISYLAALTKRIKLGLLVTCNFFRHPALLVKTVSTIDFISEGRAFLGIGAGWYEREAKGLGIAYPSLRERFERLEETLQIAKHMWRGDVTPYEGKYYRLVEPINSPQPISNPHPPILIGMWRGGPRMLRLTARYADACNFQFGTALCEWPDWLRAKYEERREFIPDRLGKLRRLCEEEGSAFEEIEKTILGKIKLAPDAMSVEDVVELCVEMKELGIEHVIFNMSNSHEITPIGIIGDEVIPEVRAL